MVPSNAAPAKVCVSCKVDVTNAPRVKDPQGRYYCQACASKVSKAPAKPVSVVAPAASGNQDFMAKIIDEAAAKAAHTCPSCQHPIAPNAQLCTGCGFNLANGKKVMTKVTRDMTKEKNVGSEEKKSRQLPTWAVWVLESNSAIVLAITVPAAITFITSLAIPQFAIIHLGLASILYVICCIWAAKDAMEESAGMALLIGLSAISAVAGFLGFGYFRFGAIYIHVYGLFLTDSPRLKIAWASYMFALVTALYILFTNPEATNF